MEEPDDRRVDARAVHYPALARSSKHSNQVRYSDYV